MLVKRMVSTSRSLNCTLGFKVMISIPWVVSFFCARGPLEQMKHSEATPTCQLVLNRTCSVFKNMHMFPYKFHIIPCSFQKNICNFSPPQTPEWQQQTAESPMFSATSGEAWQCQRASEMDGIHHSSPQKPRQESLGEVVVRYFSHRDARCSF